MQAQPNDSDRYIYRWYLNKQTNFTHSILLMSYITIAQKNPFQGRGEKVKVIKAIKWDNLTIQMLICRVRYDFICLPMEDY